MLFKKLAPQILQTCAAFSLLCRCWWFLSSTGWVKPRSQVSHLYGRTSLCILLINEKPIKHLAPSLCVNYSILMSVCTYIMWSLNLSFLENSLLQIGQIKALTTSCMPRCRANCLMAWNASNEMNVHLLNYNFWIKAIALIQRLPLSHRSHLNGRSPVWRRMCVINRDAFLNPAPHAEHKCVWIFDLSICIFRCSLQSIGNQLPI